MRVQPCRDSPRSFKLRMMRRIGSSSIQVKGAAQHVGTLTRTVDVSAAAVRAASSEQRCALACIILLLMTASCTT